MKRFLYVEVEDLLGGKGLYCDSAGDKGDIAVMLAYAARKLAKEIGVDTSALLRVVEHTVDILPEKGSEVIHI